MDWGSITRPGARTPGVERIVCSNGGAQAHNCPDSERGRTVESDEREGGMQTRWARPWGAYIGKAPSDRPTLKPYRGKPAVRNFRGGDGNVGIMRSPVRAIALPDNRHAYKKGVRAEQHVVQEG
jgi:hypothetical protein